MPITVLVVDDSNFFCRRVAQILSADPEIKVVGIANNGREAIQKAQQLKPNVITLDVEMPIMDGITALKEIMRVAPTKALMLSSLTFEGAKLTLDALDAGAADFMLKSYEGISQSSGKLAETLREKVKHIGRSTTQPPKSDALTKEKNNDSQAHDKRVEPVTATKREGNRREFDILLIGSSTGGPVAVQKILAGLPSGFPIPITITQHMPGTFTGAFAQRLNGLCALTVTEAVDGAVLRPGHVYIAPGGKQMVIEGAGQAAKIRIRPSDERLTYAPSVDLTFGSAVKAFGKKTLAVVLTGMGADGREGCRLLKQVGASVWTQDEASCVVYGMPMSVVKAGFSDKQLPLDQIAGHINQVIT